MKNMKKMNFQNKKMILNNNKFNNFHKNLHQMKLNNNMKYAKTVIEAFLRGDQLCIKRAVHQINL